MTISVLLVEDGIGDIRLTKESFRSVDPTICVETVPDGVEAMAFLRQKGSYSNAPRPDLILLDLNLPKMDGRDVLALIKKDENLKGIPVIVMTTSENETDILISYRLRANCYIRKPLQWDGFESIIKGITEMWVLLPSSSNRAERKQSLLSA